MPESKPKTSTNKPLSHTHWYDKSLKEMWVDIKDYLEDLVDLRDGMDQKGTLENIHNNKRMKGANAWLLMCSIMVASLGLNLNSPAVIIGAMLISPLMSPILGIGLGFAINDRRTLLVSLQHFFIAIVIALVTSYLYFKFTPLKELTDEISGRTAPNLLDGLVAIFGGTAGVISTTRKDKSNAIPGVAIATALMPPLCVAGYGLADGNFQFFLNAFYLFFLNSFFIALSTYVVIRLLRFRYKQYPNPVEKRRNTIVMAIFSILILLPAIYLLRKAYFELKDKQLVEKFIQKHFEDQDTRISDWELNKTDSILYVDVELIGAPVTKEVTNNCDLMLDSLLNKKVKVTTYQSKEIPFDEIQRLKTQFGGLQEGLVDQVDNLRKLQEERELKIAELTRELDSMQNKVILADIFQQAKIAFPSIEEIGLSKEFQQTDFSSKETEAVPTQLPILLVKWNRNKNKNTRLAEQERLVKLIKMQAKLDTLSVLAY